MPDINRFLNHDVRVAQLENNALRTYIAPSLGAALRDIRRLLADIEDITNRRQLRALERAIEDVIRGEQGWATLNAELTEFAEFESQFIAGVVGAGTTAADAERVRRLANNTMMVLRSGDQFDTGLWPDFIERNMEHQARQVNNMVRAAYANGLTAREVRGQVSNLFDGLIMRNAETLVRTGYAHHATIGRRAFGQANSDIVEREVPIITFDSRTSDTCLSIGAQYGQKGWPAGDSPIGYPPYHYKCRTSLGYLAQGQKLTGTRATEDGQVPATMTIDQFFQQKDRDWLVDALGEKRAELFIKGDLKLRNLTNAQLQPLTLKELRDSGE